MKQISLTLLFVLTVFFADAQIWIEDWDGGNTTNPPSFTYENYCTSRDYLDSLCIEGAGCNNEMNADYLYNGVTGQFFGARDTDHNGCAGNVNGETMSFTGIDISSCAYPNVTYLCVKIVESRNMAGPFGAEWGTSCGCEDTWDGNTSVQFRASIDGAAFTPVTQVEAFNGSDTRPGIDIGCDGNADDAGDTEITDTFLEYCFELPQLGASLDLEIEFIGFNTAGEDVGIDDIAIHCEADETTLPAGSTFLPACTPFTSTPPGTLWKENFDGTNTTGIDFSFPCIIDDSRDYFGVVCNPGGPCGNDDINADYSYVNATGSFFGARDINGDPCMDDNPQTSMATGIDISSCAGASTLILCFDIAESDSQPREGMDTWDGNQSVANNNSFVTFTVNIDGTANDIISFAAIANNNSGPANDTNCDGTGDGTALTEAFSNYCVELPSLGSNLDLAFTIGGLNTDGDDVAIDNICIICNDNPVDLPSTPVISCVVATVPVELVYFEGQKVENESLLSWQTAAEWNNDYFEVQHSVNGVDFYPIGRIQGNGTTNELLTYDFIHNRPAIGANYYRLKQMDFNGEFDLSETIILVHDDESKEGKIFPNPGNSNVIFEGESSTLEFFNIQGQKLLEIETDSGYTNLDISKLEIGYYLVKINAKNGESSVLNFVKSK